MNDEPKPIRTAARERQPLGGPDAQALEGALTMTERERDALASQLAKARGLVAKFDGAKDSDEELAIIHELEAWAASLDTPSPTAGKGDHADCECCKRFLCLVPDACRCEAKFPAKETADGVQLCERCWSEAFEASPTAPAVDWQDRATQTRIEAWELRRRLEEVAAPAFRELRTLEERHALERDDATWVRADAVAEIADRALAATPCPDTRGEAMSAKLKKRKRRSDPEPDTHTCRHGVACLPGEACKACVAESLRMSTRELDAWMRREKLRRN